MLRGHAPITLDEFNGLWKRGEPEEVPLDHFTDCNNIQFMGDKSIESRYGIDPFQSVATGIRQCVRAYNYITNEGSTLLMLKWDGTTGSIYHIVNSTTLYGPILTITGMSDFAFVPYGGRAYISPFTTYVVGGLNQEKGLQNEFLYVYAGDGTAARKAAGAPGAGTITVSNGAAGHTDAGSKLFAVVGETDSGYLSAPVAFSALFATTAGLSVSFANIPTFTGSQWTKRHIVATKSIIDYNGDNQGYTYYFLPNGTINDNTTTTLSNISFYDADLLEDASHLLDNYSEIPAGVKLNIYHDRLILTTTYNNISVVLVSAQGEPEAINQVDGLLALPLDGNPITNAQELRDVLYVFKRNKTVAFVDNGEEPSAWEMTVVDQAYGTCVHGIATVIDSGSSMVDYLLVANYKGILIFTGSYVIPELSWKVADFWADQDRDDFRYVQLVNEPISQNLYCALPDRTMLIGNYTNGLSPDKIRWSPWSFAIRINTIALVNIDTLVIGSEATL